MSETTRTRIGCFGCLGTIIILILIWALIFGVTIGGRHYGISSCDGEGVHIQTGE
jgi:hypothetical protein